MSLAIALGWPMSIAHPALCHLEMLRLGDGKLFVLAAATLGRAIAQVVGSSGSGWLDKFTRELEERPSRAIDALKFKSTDIEDRWFCVGDG